MKLGRVVRKPLLVGNPMRYIKAAVPQCESQALRGAVLLFVLPCTIVLPYLLAYDDSVKLFAA
eukprot:4996856-Pleurochrysis_carterae.AAC.2